jgi:ubiquinone/menaquinone biosynthesis C-methylase UbiE/broad specificity phosphatase PhoE
MEKRQPVNERGRPPLSNRVGPLLGRTDFIDLVSVRPFGMMAAELAEAVSIDRGVSNLNTPSSSVQRPHRRDNVHASPDMRVLFICHAEDMHDRYDHLGNVNSGLTAQGWEQADVLATWLRAHELVDVLVSDNLLQCRLTAQRLGQALGLPVTVHRELPLCVSAIWDEVDITGEEARRLAGSVGVQIELAGSIAKSANVEALVSALDKLFGEHWGTTMALVTCAGNITSVLHYLAGSQGVDVHIDSTGISELRFLHGHWQVSYMNRAPHLPVPVVTPHSSREEPVQIPEEVEDLSTIIQVYNRVAAGDLDRKREDDRQRIRHLLNFAKLPPDLRILDIGTGIGLLPVMLAEDGAKSVVGIDVSPQMLEQAEYLRLSRSTDASSRVSYRLAPAHALPFHEETFDAVTCRLVLNHARRPERLIREIVRVLRPGGVLILAELLSVDNPVKRATQNAIEERRNPSHVAARGVEQYNKLLTDAGLVIEAKETVSFERELEEWLTAYHTDRGDAAIVREMIEAGLETDAAGIHAKRQGNTLVFEQRTYYLRAVKPGPRT